ncbi:hypothetical protein SAMN02745127_00394 [Oceanospirillum multiglobuliferum]|uniref:UPF0178 protein BTE48_02230 n=1 Tax=Oceanospirillum multiglobuliferum TaxID=64969 RepID=A0A1T4LB35_9GAMM|nr:YaiI/YqxD family protein [Oceanospirillum multiglobuliferum]OPX56727.1 DUF188 domain-containing protein [Oceanospirillum multiglobuliferum]SJZ51906.1 hypothetical protein SAMN02745127_00394 [Oceanospirillum multiglobuliferum]
MQIWVDADACPKVIKEILFRASQRLSLPMFLVANQPIAVPAVAHIKSVQVASGFDVADNYIVQNLKKGDLVITADIPLADEVIDAGGHALNPRGELYTKDNIKERLMMRDFMSDLRGSGVHTGGPAALTQKDRQVFANALDRFLAKHYQP